MWTVEFHPKAKEEIAELPPPLRLKMDVLIDTIEMDGFERLSQKKVKPVEDGIMEFRVRGRDGIARSLGVKFKMRMIPWKEIKAEWAKEPGYAEAYAREA